MIVYEWDSLSVQVSCADWIVGTGLYQVIGISALSLTVLSETFDVIFLQFQFSSVLLQEVCCLFYGREDRLWLEWTVFVPCVAAEKDIHFSLYSVTCCHILSDYLG